MLEQKPRPGGVLFRLRIQKAAGGGGRAALVRTAAKRPTTTTVATFWRKAPKVAGKHRINLKHRALRGLKPGRYVVEVTPMNAQRKAVGKAVRIAFRVR